MPDKNGERIMEYLEKQGSITIKEVRALLGVKKGQTAFSRYFKRETGLSPTEYREQ